MFASILFKDIPCPYRPECSRKEYCIYSHKPMPPQEPTPAHPPAKRKPELARPPQDKPSKRNLETRHTDNTPPQQSTKQTPLSAMEISKKRRLALETIVPSTHASSSKSSEIRGSKPAEAVLLARPQITKNVAAKSSTPVSLSVSGPPVLKIDLRSHSKPQFRQAVATQYYNEFLRIYAPLASVGSNLATIHAMEQEKDVHGKTNQGSYRSLAASILQRLKKRPVSISENDVGIDDAWVDPATVQKEQDNWKAAKVYIQTLDELEEAGYPTAVPTSEPAQLKTAQICDRCQQRFELTKTISETEKSLCHFHDRRIRSKIMNGDRIKYHPCCDGAQGSPGCQEGPHVFKEDDFQLLHSRVPFVQTPKARKEDGDRHEVVAIDCEMCYTMGGFEMIRLSVVDKEGKVILDELVKPKESVLDLNSRYSGITSLDKAKLDLVQARNKFLDLIDSNTIIIGQSLENDFKVLRLVHNRVIDTSMLYPHPRRDQNYRYSLQALAKQHLHINIQDSEDGHDSFEDAKTCLELVRLKLQQDKSNTSSG